MSEYYKQSGVNLEAGYDVVNRIKKHVNKTNRPGMLGGIGQFGGLFDLSTLNIKEPVLVSGTDGVGTKCMLAIEMNKHDTIGQDLVAMCVNDIITQGAEPLYFLDYIAIKQNVPQKVESIVEGISNGCIKAGCALIGGETAEMPDLYSDGHYDLAGFSVGVVEKQKLITGEKVSAGDVIIGIKSSGIHSNGYSLVRKLLKDHNIDLTEYHPNLKMSIGEALLIPTKIYVKPVLALLKEVDIHGMAHITGGGFKENIPRTLKEGQGVEINLDSYDIPPVFEYIKQLGNIPANDMFNIFNMGIGFILIVSNNEVGKTLSILNSLQEEAVVIGKVIEEEGVHLV